MIARIFEISSSAYGAPRGDPVATRRHHLQAAVQHPLPPMPQLPRQPPFLLHAAEQSAVVAALRALPTSGGI